MTKQEEMKKLQKKLTALKRSPLYAYRIENKYLTVMGAGSLDAKIMFVGEAPGKNEAQTGRPFCGASGKFLDILLGTVNLKREDVYITSVVKDRPPENRDPTPREIEIYAPLLDRQLEIIQPKVIVTLGRHSMSYLMNAYGLVKDLGPISKLHGKSFDAKASFGPVSIVTLYHPAAALYNGGMREALKADFQVLKPYL